MEDCQSKKSSADHAPNTTAQRASSAAPTAGNPPLGLTRLPAFKNLYEPFTKSQFDLARSNEKLNVGLTGLTSSPLLSPTGRLPGIPEEKELAQGGGGGGAGEAGKGKRGKEIVVVNRDGNGLVTAKEELVKDLETRFSLEEVANAAAVSRRRLLLNSLSARRCRQRKAQAVINKEEMVKTLEFEIEVMKPQIKGHEESQKKLRMENSILKARISASEKHVQLKTFEIEEKQAEIWRLKAQLSLAPAIFYSSQAVASNSQHQYSYSKNDA